MTSSDNFFCTLPSNSSLNLFPENVLSRYRVQLSKPITLAGEWETGVSEVSFPSSLRTSFEGEFLIITRSDSPEQIAASQPITLVSPYTEEAAERGVILRTEKASEKVPSEYRYNSPAQQSELRVFSHTLDPLKTYSNIEEFIERLNQDLHHVAPLRARARPLAQDSRFRHSIQIALQPHLQVIIRDKYLILTIDSRIGQLLGFPLAENEYLQFKEAGIYNYPFITPNLQALKPRFLYLYSNIIIPQYVGHAYVPLLKTIHFPSSAAAESSSSDHQISLQYNSVQYIPLSTNTISTIELDWRTPTGRPVPFNFGLSYVVLHFRRKKKHQDV